MLTTDRAKARRERAQALARQDIIEAALRCFANHGYPNTKMSDIATEAGYTAASLYTYFPGKLEIFSAATEQFMSEVTASFGERPEQPCETFEALADEVRRRIRTLCAFGDLKHEVLGFFMRLRWNSEPVLAELRSRLVSECPPGCVPHDSGGAESEVDRYFTELWAALGVERFGIRPDVIAGVMGGVIESFFARHYLLGQGGTLLADADAIADLILYGLRGPVTQDARESK
jgi:AcrR family transcriptional regulator